MIPFRKQSKDFILDLLRKMNKEHDDNAPIDDDDPPSLADAIKRLKSALDLLKADPVSVDDFRKKLKSASDAGVYAHDQKLDVVCGFPGIEAKPGVEIPFSPIYETFYDADKLYFTWEPDHEAAVSLSDRIKQSAKEVEVNLIDKYKKLYDDPEVVDILKEIVKELRKRADAILTEGKAVPTTSSAHLRSLKMKFFGRFKTAINLGAVYDLCGELDDYIDSGIASIFGIQKEIDKAIADQKPLDKDRIRKMIKSAQDYLDAAEDSKKRLEKFVRDTAAGE